MSEQNKIEQIKEDLNPIADEVWEKDVFDVITNQDGKIIAEVFDKDAAQLFAKAPETLRFYADPNTWRMKHVKGDIYSCAANEDTGDKAREAL